MSLRLVPITQRAACRYVLEHHRHNRPPRGDVIRVALEDDGLLVGVGIAGRPVARRLDDGLTLEITRIATDGTPNACSMLYGALTRAGAALGFRRFVTYTLATEPGSSLRAAGWARASTVKFERGWDRAARPREPVLAEHRIRWEKVA